MTEELNEEVNDESNAPKNFREYLNEMKKDKILVKKESGGDYSVTKNGKVIASGISEDEAEERKKAELSN